MQFVDTYKHKGLRKQLIEKLREDTRITNEFIFDAFESIPRHYFLDNAFVEQAYSNIAFQIGAGQTISHPITVAFQTQLLDLQPNEKVLEIGTGSGFQTLILFEMGVNVVSIERQRELYLKTKPLIENLIRHNKEIRRDVFQEQKLAVNSNARLSKLEKMEVLKRLDINYRAKHFSPRLILGDGYLGSPTNAPFDKIIVTCGAPTIPQALIDQLKPGGVMIIPVGEGSEQVMQRIVKNEEGSISIEEHGTFKFVPMLENINK
ncbi:MAG: protein-L-isoaspartate O-methyltransferase [Bacteroidota bacterium]